MQKVITNEEFRSFLPALERKAYATFERDFIEEDSSRAPILWKDILIDEYNRYRICTEHNIPIDTVFSKPAVEVEAIVAEFEDGTYEIIQPAAALPVKDSDSAIPLSDEMQRFDTVISNITGDFVSVLQELYKSGGMADLRIALWSYIDTLEEFYKKA